MRRRPLRLTGWPLSRFGVYYYGKTLIGADKKPVDSRTNFALALTSGGLAALIAQPFFTLKTQFQVQSSVSELAGVGHQAQHTNLFNAFGTIVREEGVTGLYKGLPAFFLRCMAMVAFQMTTYDATKSMLIESKTM